MNLTEGALCRGELGMTGGEVVLPNVKFRNDFCSYISGVLILKR